MARTLRADRVRSFESTDVSRSIRVFECTLQRPSHRCQGWEGRGSGKWRIRASFDATFQIFGTEVEAKNQSTGPRPTNELTADTIACAPSCATGSLPTILP